MLILEAKRWSLCRLEHTNYRYGGHNDDDIEVISIDENDDIVSDVYHCHHRQLCIYMCEVNERLVLAAEFWRDDIIDDEIDTDMVDEQTIKPLDDEVELI